jgi:hypothetical protein
MTEPHSERKLGFLGFKLLLGNKFVGERRAAEVQKFFNAALGAENALTEALLGLIHFVRLQ